MKCYFGQNFIHICRISLLKCTYLKSHTIRNISASTKPFNNTQKNLSKFGNFLNTYSYRKSNLFLSIELLNKQKVDYCTSSQNEKKNNNEDFYFGNETVTKEEKTKKVHSVFENVAEKYDLMNDIMSGGIHRLWKDYFVGGLDPTVDIKLLDVAGGTGDITFRVLKYIQNKIDENTSKSPIEESSKLLNYEKDIYSDEENRQEPENDKCKITVYDLSENMLSVGRQRAESLGYEDIEWVCGDAQELPFPDNSFDAYTIAYGMRNVADVKKALSEAYRVLKPGGRFMCLEFSHVENSLIRSVYDMYSFQLIPVMGQLIAADWKSYQYLVESIRKFPDQERYKSMIEEVGFRNVLYENLTFGVTAIHSGFKI